MNRKKSRQVLSTKQLFAILIAGTLGHGLISLGRITVMRAGQDGWISMLISGAIAFFGMNLILFFMNFFPNKTFIQISEEVLGKYLGKIPGLLIFTYYLALATLSLRVMADLSSSWLLPKTPIEIIMLSISLILFYLTRNGIKVFGRLSEMLIWILIPIIPLLFIPFFQYGKLLNILPVMADGIMPVLSASFPAMYAFMGFESLLILYPYVREDTSHIEIVKISNFALFLVIGIKTFVVFSNIATFGAIEIEFLLYPLLEYFKLIVFPVIQRVEFLLIFYWLFIFFGSISLYFYMTNLSLEQMLKIEGYKNTGFFLIFPLYYLTRIPQNVGEVMYYIDLLGIWGAATMFATIFLVIGVALIRGRRKERET